MDATIKATSRELVIRLANGCTLHQRLNAHDSVPTLVRVYAPGGHIIFESMRPAAAAKALQTAINHAPQQVEDAARWRFVLPLLRHHLKSQHYEDVNGPEMYLAIGEREMRTGRTGGYTDELITTAIDAAMRAALARAPGRARGRWTVASLQHVREEIAYHLAEIKRLFKPGVKLTLLVRSPGFPDGSRDVVTTNDTLAEAITALQVSAASETVTVTPPDQPTEARHVG